MEDGEKPSHGIADMDVVDATLQSHRVASDQVMVLQGHDIKNGDSGPAHLPEASVINNNQFEVEDAQTVSHQELTTPKPKEKNVREMKNVLNDTEVLTSSKDIRAFCCCSYFVDFLLSRH